MPRFFFPSYPTKPHASGQARIRIKGIDHYLGVWGSQQSKTKYAELAAQHAAKPEGPAPPRGQVVTVAEVVARWHAQAVKDRGEKCGEVVNVISACGPLVRLFGSEDAAAFDALKLSTVREAMLSGSWMNDEERAIRAKKQSAIGWCRGHANHQVGRVRTVWRWAGAPEGASGEEVEGRREEDGEVGC